MCTALDKHCKYHSDTHVECPEGSKGCFTLYENDQNYARGCAWEDNKYWGYCQKNMLNCHLCRYELCNSSPMRVPRTLACVTSTATPLEEPNLMPRVCDGEIPVGVADSCYMLVGQRNGIYTVIERGCYPFPGQVTEDTALFYCQDDGCNAYGPVNGVSCYMGNATFSSPGANSIKSITCMDKRKDIQSQHQFPILCYNNLVNGHFSDGCMNRDMRQFAQVKRCGYDEKSGATRTCQVCITRMNCNYFIRTLADYRNLERCRNLRNEVEVCPNIGSSCFIHLVRGKAVDAGCVQPTTNWEILTHQDTHFCLSQQPPYQGCFDLREDYSKRVSCYVCNEANHHPACTDPANLLSSFKKMCPVGATGCVSMVLHKDMRRGCDHHDDGIAQICSRNPSLCLYCDSNYCNGLGLQENPAKCYSTTRIGGMHSTTLQLQRCDDRLPAPTHDPCYIARRPHTVLIRAGCLEDMDLSGGYELHLHGGSEIIFQEKIHCYKCRSRSAERCFSVRWHEPELCQDHTITALHGCYTMFDQQFQRIERGCLSELSSYKVGICLAKHLEELCIACPESYCNIHTA